MAPRGVMLTFAEKIMWKRLPSIEFAMGYYTEMSVSGSPMSIYGVLKRSRLMSLLFVRYWNECKYKVCAKYNT